AYETGVTDTVDPMGGSYYVEALTNEIFDRADEYIQKIDAMGGAVSAIERGYVQKEIQESAYRYQKEIESGERIVVGVNRFQVEEERPTNLLRVDPAVRIAQIEKLKALRAERDEQKVKDTLGRLREAAQGTENLMSPILDAVKAYATLGEICDVLRAVFGEYQPSTSLA
ncbi:methylmalonyl-CoA mutase, partial [Methanosarcinales archaeon]